MDDPTAGPYSYTYNAYGQLLAESGGLGGTDYEYYDWGGLKEKHQKGDATDLKTAYDYDPNSRLLSSQSTRDDYYGGTYDTRYNYDGYGRQTLAEEDNGYVVFTQDTRYGTDGRVAGQLRKLNPYGEGHSSVQIDYAYAPNGSLSKLTDGRTNQTLWEATATNARGQHTQVRLGSGKTATHSYDTAGFLENSSTPGLLEMDYAYNKKKGLLTRRSRKGANPETFSYDTQKRLIRTRQNGIPSFTQKYDTYGRVAKNMRVGLYNYTDPHSRYVLDSVTLNGPGYNYYKEHWRKATAYNMGRKVVHVSEAGYGKADFAYNAQMQRVTAWYGNADENLDNRRYRKAYATIFPAEARYDSLTRRTTPIHFLGGDPYTAPLVKIGNDYRYLHRDLQGSILAISDESGTLLEERSFDPWGLLQSFKQNGQETAFKNTLLNRGYTGHEHFEQTELIHMNGRLYDPRMHRFLGPDNFLTDPLDPRAYDRFAYAYNNPLSYVDYNGELALAAIIKGLYAAYRVAATVKGYMDGDLRGPLPAILTAAAVGLAAADIAGAEIPFLGVGGTGEGFFVPADIAVAVLQSLGTEALIDSTKQNISDNTPNETNVTTPETPSTPSTPTPNTPNLGNTTPNTSFANLEETATQGVCLDCPLENFVGADVEVPIGPITPDLGGGLLQSVLDTVIGVIDDLIDGSEEGQETTNTCPTTTGYLHTAAFASTVSQGTHTIVNADNFRDATGAIITETNCDTGKIYADETVEVLSTETVTLPGLGNNRYYPINFKNCDGNQPDNEDYDSDKPCADCDDGGNPFTIPLEIVGTENHPDTGGDFGENVRGLGVHHKGVDLKAPIGTNIYAANAGKIIKVVSDHPDDAKDNADYQDNDGKFVWNSYRDSRIENGQDYDRGGNRVIVEYVRNGVTFTQNYMHMKNDSNNHLSVGDVINVGDLLGEVGITGNAQAIPEASTHLHMQVVNTSQVNTGNLGNKVDPNSHIFGNMNYDTGEDTNPCNNN